MKFTISGFTWNQVKKKKTRSVLPNLESWANLKNLSSDLVDRNIDIFNQYSWVTQDEIYLFNLF